MPEETSSKPAEIHISELNIENETLKIKVDELKQALDEANAALKLANDVIEADIKGRLSTKIIAGSKYTVEDLSKMSVDEMKRVEQVLDMSSATYQGIRPGFGVTSDDANRTVPDKYAFGKKEA